MNGLTIMISQGNKACLVDQKEDGKKACKQTSQQTMC